MPEAINLKDKLTTFAEHWSPRIVATFNGNDVMVVKVKGEFVWHAHADTDDFFLCLDGHLRIETEDGTVHLGPGDLHIVPKGMRHRPVADEEAHVMVIEPTGEPNSGDSTEREPATKVQA